MKTFKWAFKADFPKRYLPLAEAAMRRACWAWEASGVVSFIYHPFGDSLDILIEHARLDERVDPATGEFYTPDMEIDRSSPTAVITVDAGRKWQTSAWQFWRWEWQPSLFAHELGHLLFDSSWHADWHGSVMHKSGQYMPDRLDIERLRALYAEDPTTV